MILGAQWGASWKTINAAAITSTVDDNYIYVQRVSQEVVSDCKVHFIAADCREVEMILQMKLLMSLVIHPTPDGPCDNFNKIAICNIHGFAIHTQANRHHNVPLAECVYNSAVH